MSVARVIAAAGVIAVVTVPGLRGCDLAADNGAGRKAQTRAIIASTIQAAAISDLAAIRHGAPRAAMAPPRAATLAKASAETNAMPRAAMAAREMTLRIDMISLQDGLSPKDPTGPDFGRGRGLI